MRKFIIAGMAVAMLAVPAIASADVQRYQSQTATFTINQSKDYDESVQQRVASRPQGHGQPVRRHVHRHRPTFDNALGAHLNRARHRLFGQRHRHQFRRRSYP